MKLQRSSASVDLLCRFFGKSRQALYQIQHRKDRRHVDEELVINYVNEYRRAMPKIGTRKLHHMLESQLQVSGIKCGRDMLFSMLSRSGLLLRKHRKCHGTTRRLPVCRHFPNLIKDMAIEASEMVWVSDTTSIAICDGLAYLTLITDAYSKQIMGYHLQRTKESSGSLTTLRMGLKGRKYPERPLVHHSDGGGEYFNRVYLQELVDAHVTASCSAPSSPQENPVAERINGILKQEFLLTEKRRSFKDVMEKLSESIRVYNQVRPHASINYMTPQQAHDCNGPLRKRWKAYRRIDRRDPGLTGIGQRIHQIMQAWVKNADAPAITKE